MPIRYRIIATQTDIPVDAPFAIGEGEDRIQFPANFLRNASDDDLTRFGIEPYEVTDEPTGASVPEAVSPRQIRLALFQLNQLSAVQAFIDAGSDDLKIEWEYATEVRRDHPMWSVGAAALGLSEEDVDGLFILAATK